MLLFFFLLSFFPQVLSFRVSMGLRPLFPGTFNFHVKPFMLLALGFTPLFFITIRRFRLSRHEPFMLLFYAYFMTTVLWAEHRGTSIKLVVGTLIMLYIFFVSKRVLQRYSIGSIEKAIAVIGMIFNSVSLIIYTVGFITMASDSPVGQSIAQFTLFKTTRIPRLRGLIYNPNYFALFNSVFFFYYLSRMKKKWYAIGVVISGTAILLTVSVGGIGAITITFIINLFLEKDRVIRRRLLFLPVAVVLIFIVLYFTMLKDTGFISYIIEKLKTGSFRYGMWGYALSLFGERPLFGIGLYNFRHFARKLFGIMNMHNTWLKTLVEGGVAGFVLFAWFNLLALRGIFKAYRRDDSARYLFLTYVSVLLIFLSVSALIHEIYFLVLALMSRYVDMDTQTVKGITQWKRTRESR